MLLEGQKVDEEVQIEEEKKQLSDGSKESRIIQNHKIVEYWW